MKLKFKVDKTGRVVTASTKFGEFKLKFKDLPNKGGLQVTGYFKEIPIKDAGKKR